MKKMKLYFNIWARYTVNSFSISLVSRFGAMIFLVAKMLRFGFFLIFLILLLSRTNNLGGYNLYQIAFFFLVFNFIDSLTQLLYREVYRFRPMIVEGRFDYVLLQPASSLFRSLTGGADVLDLLMLIPIIIALIYVSFHLPSVTLLNIFIFILLLINSLILATSFNILVLAIGILTTTVDHTVMIYRDLTSMGRIPVDIYREPLRGLLTFVIPVGVLMTFPAKSIMGLLSFQGIIISFCVGIMFFYLSLRFWQYALTKYSSASS